MRISDWSSDVCSSDLPRGKLKNAIDAYARQTGRQVIYKADEIANAHSRGVRGNISPDGALAKLLQGTGFSYRTDSSGAIAIVRSEEHTSELQSLMRISYAVFCLKKKKKQKKHTMPNTNITQHHQ